MRKGPLTCDDVGSGATRQTCVHWFAPRAFSADKRGCLGICHPSVMNMPPFNQTLRTAI